MLAQPHTPLITSIAIPSGFRLGRLLAGFCLALNMSAAAFAQDDVAFAIPRSDARESLELFSDQSGMQLVYLVDQVAGVTTNAVKGKFAPATALTTLLDGTPLVFAQDARNRAFTIKRKDATNKPVTENAPKEEVLQLEKFTVSTSLGTYVEAESAAGSKVPMSMRELASTVQVLNASFISDLKAKELDDLYPYVVGMTRQLRTSTGFTLRGFSALGASLASVQVDGLPGLATRFGSPTTANIDRVEVLKGPTSVLYGQNNPGGLINMVSKRPQAKAATDLTLSVSSYAGTNSPLGDDLGVITQIDSTGPIDSDKKWLYRAIVSYERLDGFRRNGYFKNFYIFPSLTYRWNEHTSLTFQGDVTRQKRRADDGLVAPFSDVGNVARYDLVYQEPDDVERDEGAGLSAVFQHNLSNGWTFKLAGRSVWHTDTKLALENGTIVSATPVQNSTHRRRYRDNYNARRFNFVDANLYGKFGSDNIRHTLLFGASYGREFSDIYRKSFTQVGVTASNVYNPSFGSIPIPPVAGVSRTVTDYDNYALYVSDQVKIGSRWHATLGLRYDRQDSSSIEVVSSRLSDQSVDAVVPNLGLVFEVSDQVSAYVSYVEGFKPSSPNSYDANGNNGFDPEASSQVEVGVKADFLDRKLSATLAFYRIEKTNVVENTGVTLPNGTAISEIFGGQRSQGVELQGAYLPVPNWQLLAGVTYIDARVTESLTAANVGAHLAGAARYSGNFWTRYNFTQGKLRGFGGGLGYIYTASRHGSTSNSPATWLNIPSYGRLDLAAYYKWRRWDLALNASNVLDRQYISTANTNVNVFPGDPREVTLTLSATF